MNRQLSYPGSARSWVLPSRKARILASQPLSSISLSPRLAAAPRLFLFLQIQALAGLVLVGAILLAAASRGALASPGTIGFAVLAMLAVTGEAIADAQLAACKRRNTPGGICEAGLWGYSRHPNYFFEWLHWFAYVLLAVGSAGFAWTLAGPVLMFAFLYRVSGIPWTEAQALRSRGEDYARYQREVSAFFPWPPRRPS